MENEKEQMNEQPQNLTDESQTKQSGFVKMRKFHFIMLLFFVVFLSAGITTFALTFGDEKAVTVTNEREEFRKLYTVFDTIKENYFKEVDENVLVNGAINGMIQSLNDPYSDYMDEKEAKVFHENISSSFEGIGAEIQEKDGYITIVSPLKGSPAEKAGLLPDDRVLEVDGKNIQGMSTSEAIMLIRGEKGTKVKLTIQRPGVEEPITMTIVRDTIPIETVYGEMIDKKNKIAKVQITSFAENTTNELLQVLNELKNQGMKGLILDLRQNPGGLLEQAIEISSLFIPEGKVLLKVEDRKGNIRELKSTNKDVIDVPLVVVIDKGSASASEIFAAAVSESIHVPLVGETSFGKGTVQNALDFKDGSNIKITTEKWLTPKGNWIHEKGIKPDYEVSLPEYASLSIINPEKEWERSDASTQIKSAQKMLKALGYDPKREDGFFDENTENAVKEFQKAHNLKETGKLKGKTSLKLMDEISKKIQKNDTQLKKAIKILKKQLVK